MYKQKLLYLYPAMENKDSVYCNCLYYSANALGRVMTSLAEEEFSVTGLAPSYAFLLMSVNAKPGVQPNELSVELQLTPSTVTRLIDKMETKGFVERRSAGRATEIFPTLKGKSIDNKIKKAWMSLYKRYVGLLGEENANQLTSFIYEATKKLSA